MDSKYNDSRKQKNIENKEKTSNKSKTEFSYDNEKPKKKNEDVYCRDEHIHREDKVEKSNKYQGEGKIKIKENIDRSRQKNVLDEKYAHSRDVKAEKCKDKDYKKKIFTSFSCSYQKEVKEDEEEKKRRNEKHRKKENEEGKRENNSQKANLEKKEKNKKDKVGYTKENRKTRKISSSSSSNSASSSRFSSSSSSSSRFSSSSSSSSSSRSSVEEDSEEEKGKNAKKDIIKESEKRKKERKIEKQKLMKELEDRGAPTIKKKKIKLKDLREIRRAMLSEHFGYSNENNPFGDSTLTEIFVWTKKNKFLRATGSTEKTTPAKLLQLAEEKVSEIEAVKRRREERDLEEKMLEEQRELLAREKEQENYDEWTLKETNFYKEQAISKTKIRLKQGRGDVVDMLVKSIRVIEGEFFFDDRILDVSPQLIFDGMLAKDLRLCLEELSIHVAQGEGLDFIDKKYQAFWNSLILLCNEALKKALEDEAEDKNKKKSKEKSVDFDSGISICIFEDIDKLLENKTYEELLKLEEDINAKLEDEELVDSAYWEAIQNKLSFFKACEEVRRITELAKIAAKDMRKRYTAEQSKQKEIEEDEDKRYLNNLILSEEEQEKLYYDKEEEAEEETRDKDLDLNFDGSYSPVLEPFEESDLVNNNTVCPSSLRDTNEFNNKEKTADKKTVNAFGKFTEPSCFSPPLYSLQDLSSNVEVLTPLDDAKRRDMLKVILIQKEKQKRAELVVKTLLSKKLKEKEEDEEEDQEDIFTANKILPYEEFVMKEKKAMISSGEVMISVAEQLVSSNNDWEDKYHARKPRFFNRVKTGFEWNKYNQAHYDFDNPPPKSVQGYKFNIFYPDLIDKTKTPTWKILPSENMDTVILKFHAGPPYEDVAFKILNREWSFDKHRGFRNTFDRGILQLYFNFKRYRYRR